ncbi:hypothetical protein [Rhodococcus globerulus]|uniref:Lipoprotein n=1 Tax=Rhodococcus globerulus TaxID=33008 RepID=A0ABU4BRU1_RHOGO|nr:hypothetical protein [Rhodococcus globerulus]MDV6266938.1 hypothetical protein [Rhodococcus globerulus]
MNKTRTSVFGLALVLLVAGCGSNDAPVTPSPSPATAPTSAPAAPATQDSGKYGIVVPGVATNPTRVAPDSISFELPGMSFDAAVQWMEAHLSFHDAVDEMMPCSTKHTPTMHSWYWGTSMNEPTLSVTVFATPITQVGIFGGTVPVDC